MRYSTYIEAFETKLRIKRPCLFYRAGDYMLKLVRLNASPNELLEELAAQSVIHNLAMCLPKFKFPKNYRIYKKLSRIL